MDNTDLSSIVNAVKLTNLPKGKLAEFCPCIHYCQNQGVDTNCFYEKFLHCDQVEELGLNNKLSSNDIQNRKVYKDKMTEINRDKY